MRDVVDPNRTLRSSVVMLHGFAQTGACLGPVVDSLTDHTVLRPDLPGHGNAAALSDLDLWGIAAHLAGAIGPTLDGPAVWFGYSMGGRVALHVALAHPELVSGLVLVGTTAGIPDPTERALRRAADLDRADRLEAIGLDAFLEEWLDQPMFAGLAEWARFDVERRRNTVAGLAGSLRHAGTGSMEPLWDRLDRIEVPTLCIVGELDRKFTDEAERLTDSGSGGLTDATVEMVVGAGHAPHLERSERVAELIGPFCADLVPRTAGRRVEEPSSRWYQP